MSADLPQRIDFFRLAINLGGNKKIIDEMLLLFLSINTEALDKLEAAERERNVVAWAQIIHKIKGSAHNITAKRLVMLCIEAEEIKQLPHAQASAMIYHLHKELALLRDAITTHLRDETLGL